MERKIEGSEGLAEEGLGGGGLGLGEGEGGGESGVDDEKKIERKEKEDGKGW